MGLRRAVDRDERRAARGGRSSTGAANAAGCCINLAHDERHRPRPAPPPSLLCDTPQLPLNCVRYNTGYISG